MLPPHSPSVPSLVPPVFLRKELVCVLDTPAFVAVAQRTHPLVAWLWLSCGVSVDGLYETVVNKEAVLNWRSPQGSGQKEPPRKRYICKP